MRRCPWCQAPLDRSQLFRLDDKVPSECRECGELIRNDHIREVVSFFPPLISFVCVLVWQLHPVFWLVPVILFPCSRILLAKPMKAEYETHVCQICNRPDAGFRTPFDRVCDACMTKEEQARKRSAR